MDAGLEHLADDHEQRMTDSRRAPLKTWTCIATALANR
jgi:hypothetical protein